MKTVQFDVFDRNFKFLGNVQASSRDDALRHARTKFRKSEPHPMIQPTKYRYGLMPRVIDDARAGSTEVKLATVQ